MKFLLYILYNLIPYYNFYLLYLKQFNILKNVKFLSTNELLFLDITLQVVNCFISNL